MEVRSPIRETLAVRVLNRKRRTLRIAVAERGPVVAAEIVFREIPVQMMIIFR